MGPTEIEYSLEKEKKISFSKHQNKKCLLNALIDVIFLSSVSTSKFPLNFIEILLARMTSGTSYDNFRVGFPLDGSNRVMLYYKKKNYILSIFIFLFLFSRQRCLFVGETLPIF